MLSRSGYQEDLSSRLVVGQQLGDIPPRRLQMPVHGHSQPAVFTAAPHPWAQDGVLGVRGGVEEEEGTWQETERVTLQVWPDRRTSSISMAGYRDQWHQSQQMLEAFLTFFTYTQPSSPFLRLCL